MEHPKTTKNVGQPCVICGQPADAQATVEALQSQVKGYQTKTYCAFCGQTYDIDTGAELIARHIKECPKHPMRDVEQQVEALQRERDEVSRKYHEAMDIMSAWKNIDHAEAVARLLEANKALDAEREKVKGQTQRAEYVEGKVRELLLKQDVLELKLSQLQVLVRALKGDANYTYRVADNPDEDDQYTVYVYVNGQGYGAIAEFYSRDEALAYAEIKRVATLPATPTESGEDHSGDDTDMVQKGGGDGE